MNRRKISKTDTETLPASGPRREALREKGQFWTPDWIADAMVAYAIGNKSESLFDPAVGAGAFFIAAKKFCERTERHVRLIGYEKDGTVLHKAIRAGLNEADLRNVKEADFILSPPSGKLSSIVANPPYIRHHRLSLEFKTTLRQIGHEATGMPLDGRAGLHIYFLILSLQLLEQNGRLAFIMPADTCEGKFAADLWRWISTHYKLEAVLTFAPNASPFPGVDTNPLIFFIKNSPPAGRFSWGKCLSHGTGDVRKWVEAGFVAHKSTDISSCDRQLDEAIACGLSRPIASAETNGPELINFAHVCRGIATGANEFFLLTGQQVRDIGLPAHFLKRVVGRTRDVPGEQVTNSTLTGLENKGRPSFLLSLDGRPASEFPENVREYLLKGEEARLNERALILQRKPWYKMETRVPPPFLFSYLGRRKGRFIRNTAGVLPLTGFLCVYPKQHDKEFLDKLWAVLCDPRTIANLGRVGKSYGSGAIKVEPRSLERLPIPVAVLQDAGLTC